MFRLDRTAFSINTFVQADNNCKYWLTRPVGERLQAAGELTRQAYGIAPDAILRMDRTGSTVRSRSMSGNVFNEDFRYLTKAFNRFDVEYLLVGGYAVIVHGHNRSTGDLNLWVKAPKENYVKLV